MLLAKLRDGAGAGTARMALEMATLGGAACLGRTGELGVLAPGAVGDVAVWSLTGPAFAGAIADPVEAWLRCGPVVGPAHGRARPAGRARRRARAPRRRGPPACAPRGGGAPSRLRVTLAVTDGSVTGDRRAASRQTVGHGTCGPERSRAWPPRRCSVVAVARRLLVGARGVVGAAGVRGARSPAASARHRRRRPTRSSTSTPWRWSATRSPSAREAELEAAFDGDRAAPTSRSTPRAGGG